MKLVKRILFGLVALIGAFGAYLLFVGLVPTISAPEQPLKRRKATGDGEATRPAGRRDVSFRCNDTTLRAWLYLPAGSSKPAPCIVMANGLGGTRDMALQPYARRFQAAGCAVLLFDYRYFGASDGEPRQLIWIPDQLDDYAAAIAYARSLPQVDPTRIVLWGTSLSGGHVIVAAARDRQVAAVIAQCPGLDGTETAEMLFKRDGLNLALIVHAQRDLVRSWLGLPAHRVPIVGPPGSVALMTTPDAYDAFASLAPEDFVNEACARIAIRGDKYRPITQAAKVRCPVLLQICEFDALLPAAPAEKTAKLLGDLAELKRYPIGHFDVYTGEGFERSVRDQLAFLHHHA